MPNRNPAQVTSIRHTVAKKLCFSRIAFVSRKRQRTATPWIRSLIAPCFCAALASPAMATDTSAFGEETMAALQEETRSAAPLSAYEVNSLVLPNLGDTNWGASAQRAGGASGFANATQHIDVTRWLTPEAPRSLGFSLGVTSAAPRPARWQTPAATSTAPPRRPAWTWACGGVRAWTAAASWTCRPGRKPRGLRPSHPTRWG